MNLGVNNAYETGGFVPGRRYSLQNVATVSFRSPPIAMHEVSLLSTARGGIMLRVPAFDVRIDIKVTDIIWSTDSNQIVFEATIDDQIHLRAVLDGDWVPRANDEPHFVQRDFGLTVVKKPSTPVHVFVTSTLWALLGLSTPTHIEIPLINYDFKAQFSLDLKQLSNLLLERDLAYRLMVIEVATGLQFQMPLGEIDGADVESIAFAYHAIVERRFDWPSFRSTIPWVSNRDNFQSLPLSSEPAPMTFRPERLERIIFGQRVPLGLMAGTIELALIENFDDVKSRLEKNSGEVVNAQIRSLTGKTHFVSLRVPTLPDNCWTPSLKRLIAIGQALDESVAGKYLGLARSSLEGLEHHQIDSITERPDLDGDSFGLS